MPILTEERNKLSTCTQAIKAIEYETKNKPSTLIERMTKQGPNPRKYIKIFEYLSCTPFLKTNGRIDEITVKLIYQ